jgi:hypothetical protein
MKGRITHITKSMFGFIINKIFFSVQKGIAKCLESIL